MVECNFQAEAKAEYSCRSHGSCFVSVLRLDRITFELVKRNCKFSASLCSILGGAKHICVIYPAYLSLLLAVSTLHQKGAYHHNYLNGSTLLITKYTHHKYVHPYFRIHIKDIAST